MAVQTLIFGYMVSGLSSDTKPSSTNGHLFLETDTGKTYSRNAGSWVELVPAQSHSHAESDVTSLVSDLALKAPLAGPTFTGTVTVPDASFANAKMANMNANTVKANATAGAAAPGDLAVGASTIVARLAAGNIVAATPAEMRTLLATPLDLNFVATPNNFNVNDTNDVTIVTRDVTGVAAGDQIVVEGAFTILNNSTATRVYVITLDFDALGDIEMSTGALATSSTLIHSFWFKGYMDIRASNLCYMVCWVGGQLAAGIASGGDFTMAATNLEGQGWATSASDATGTTTVALKVRSANATSTQTLRLHHMSIRKHTPG